MSWKYYQNENSDIAFGDIKGKYLFFWSDKEYLISLGKRIMEEFSLPMMKVPKGDEPNDSPGFEFVLCVYDISDRYKHDIISYLMENNIPVKYRYYKSNEDTIRKNYSKQFKLSKHGQSKNAGI